MGSISKKFRGYYTLQFDWSLESQSAVNNTSTISWVMYLIIDEGASISYPNGQWSAEINGTTYYDYTNSFGPTDKLEGPMWYTLSTGTHTVQHNENGEVVVDVSLMYNPQSYTIFNYGSASATNIANVTTSEAFTLPTITKVPTITAVSYNLTDESDPIVHFVNPLGEAASQVVVKMCFADDNPEETNIAKRYVNTTATNATFTLINSERRPIWDLLDEDIFSTQVKFYVEVTYDGTVYRSEPVTRQVTIIEKYPTINPTMYDTNEKTIALTGNRNKLVRYASDVYFDVGAEAYKGAMIDGTVTVNGDQYSYQSTGVIEDVTSNIFNFIATDSRGNTTRSSEIFTINDGFFIEYVKLTCSIANDPLTAEGDLTVHLSGKYWEGNFGVVDNSVNMQYNCTDNDGNTISSDVVKITPIVDDNHNYTYTFTISGLDYKKQYRVYVTVGDALTLVNSPTIVVAPGEPLFDWGKNDFQFYIPVTFNAGYNATQKVLWEGVKQMDSGESITLSESISKQSNGVMLVFSLYRNDAAEDVSVHTAYISKKVVELMPYAKHTFFLQINNNLSVVGCKYLTVSDSNITGDASNTNSGTAAGSGITFNNSNFVLRYVIGV